MEQKGPALLLHSPTLCWQIFLKKSLSTNPCLQMLMVSTPTNTQFNKINTIFSNNHLYILKSLIFLIINILSRERHHLVIVINICWCLVKLSIVFKCWMITFTYCSRNIYLSILLLKSFPFWGFFKIYFRFLLLVLILCQKNTLEYFIYYVCCFITLLIAFMTMKKILLWWNPLYWLSFLCLCIGSREKFPMA